METREELRQRVRQEQKITARVRTAATRFDDAQTERNWAIVVTHRAGLSIRQIALAAGISSSRVHQLLKEIDATEIPAWLSQVRQEAGQSGEDGQEELTNPETKIRAQVAAEATILRQCLHWLEQLD